VVYLVRFLIFVITAAVLWGALDLLLGFVVLQIWGIEAVKDCGYIECKQPGEFIYDTSSPLVPLLLTIPSLAGGLLIARRVG
jgi:hypothetical protein